MKDFLPRKTSSYFNRLQFRNPIMRLDSATQTEAAIQENIKYSDKVYGNELF
jgi:hypothetical protein